jgi:dipeptidyl aminopeptidase/acylaminoacyl peptidase
MKSHTSSRCIERLFILSVFLFLILSLNSPSQAAFVDPHLKWKTIKTEHFNITYHESEEEVAFRMATITERVYAKLSPKLEWKPWGRTEVVLTDTTDVTNAFATTLPYNYMLIFISPPEGNSALSYYDNWLEDLFTHEFTHILHIDKYGGIAKPFRWVFGKIVTPNGLTPGWVREGIAVYEESQNGRGRNNNSFSDMMLRTDILNNQFLGIDEAAGLKIDWPSGNAAYIYGGAFWQYLADTYGAEKIVEFIRRYGDSMWLFSLNNKARKTFDDKHFVKLWREWKETLEQKYTKVKGELTSQGLTNFKTLLHIKGNLKAPTLSPDGKKLVYARTDVDKEPEIRMFDLMTKEDTLLAKGRTTEQISFSPDGQKIVFGSIGTYKLYYSYDDLYEVDLSTKKMVPLTQGKRALDPDYSPDGKSIVYVGRELSSSQLFLYDRESKKEKQISQAPLFTQFSNPRFSPDGKKIVVSAWMNGNRDLYLYNLEGKIETQLTNDKAIDNQPRWSKDGNFVYFTSDRSGISNIYKIGVESKKQGEAEKITNVLTGLFEPQPDPENQTVIAQNYFGKGYDIVQFEEPKSSEAVHAPSLHRRSHAKKQGQGKTSPSKGDSATTSHVSKDEVAEAPQETQQPETQHYEAKKYTPFTPKLFLPRYILPGFFFGDGVGVFSGTIGSRDPLGRHIWSGDVTYRTDANYLGGDIFYTYNRWHTPLYLGFDDYVVSYGDIFGINQDFFEARKRVFAGIRLPYGRNRFDIAYVFERRSDASGLPAGADQFLNLGNFAGFRASYIFTRVKKYPASISLEGGPRLRLSLEVNDTALGSSPRNETKIFEGDLREYIQIPWTKHHVFALRTSGGINWGDKIFPGVFRLGGAFGEGVISENTPHLYPLRGLPQVTFAGDRAMLFSGEYRIPLLSPQRGITTTPIFLNNLHLAFFGDFGSVFEGSPHLNEFLLGVGAEIRGDFVIGYGLPITGRLGYAIIVKGREFLDSLTDPVTGASIKNGALILEVGTSF